MQILPIHKNINDQEAIDIVKLRARIVYGKHIFNSQKYFKAISKGDKWIVFSRPCLPEENCLGNGIEAKVKKSNGQVLFMTRTK